MSNDTQVAAHMALVDKFAETCVRPVTLENVKVAEKARAAVEASARQLAEQGAPGFVMVPVDDPLQGAVDWFLQADGEFFCVATVQRTLRIGYNRAKRLCDVAKERAARPLTASRQTSEPPKTPVGEQTEAELQRTMLIALHDLYTEYCNVKHEWYDRPDSDWSPERDDDKAALAAKDLLQEAKLI